MKKEQAFKHGKIAQNHSECKRTERTKNHISAREKKLNAKRESAFGV